MPEQSTKNSFPTPLWILRLWKVWFALLGVLFVARLLLLGGANEDVRFAVFAVYLIALWPTLMLLNFYTIVKLSLYLNKNHLLEKHLWSRTASLSGSIKLGFLLSDEDLGDTEVGRLKHECKSFLKLVLTFFCTVPFFFVAFMLGASPR